MKKLSLLAACLFLSACTSMSELKNSELSALTVEEQILSCNNRDLNLDLNDDDDDDKVKIASKNAIYAMLSNNAYDDDRYKFVLPDSWEEIKIYSHSDSSGLDYKIYEKKENQKIVEAVIVFRGTAGPIDWLYGNLSSKQYKYANPHITMFVNNYKNKTANLKATGHSLGGGLAMYASYQFDGIEAIGFNASPRYHSRKVKKDNKRIAIWEQGEFLRMFGNVAYPWRWTLIKGKSDIDFYKYHFVENFGLSNHQSTHLARGLLLTGSFVNPELQEVLDKNCG